MASSLTAGFCSFCSCPKQKKKKLEFPRVRSSQSFKDEGKRADIVDANLSTLRKRIEEVKKKEMLCCRLENGWNYKRSYDDHYRNRKRADILYGSVQMMGFVGGAVGFVFLSGSLCLFLVSFLVNLSSLSN
ncbi:hypothetical protein AB3S75_009033 [Citrus x aurantiifolia]